MARANTKSRKGKEKEAPVDPPQLEEPPPPNENVPPDDNHPRRDAEETAKPVTPP